LLTDISIVVPCAVPVASAVGIRFTLGPRSHSN
jgi:hypothetical protein